jgi:uncharacterized membrane protein YhaH (DUF805 family)
MRLRDVDGRTNRIGFAAYVLFVNLGVALALQYILLRSDLGLVGFYFAIGISAFGTLVIAAAVIRRFHDLGRSVWWILWLFVPLVNVGFLLYLLLWPGQPVENDFGEPPGRTEPEQAPLAPLNRPTIEQNADSAPRGILWPKRATSASTMSVRLGRVLHWFSSGVAAIIAVTAGGSYLMYGYLSDVMPALMLAVVVFFAGRGLRYVFAGE